MDSQSPNNRFIVGRNRPYARPHQAWQCGRVREGDEPCPYGPSKRGQCRENPVCRPVRSRRRLRGWLSIVTVLAIVLTLIGTQFKQERYHTLIDPGELAAVHHHIGDDCSMCHAMASDEGDSVNIGDSVSENDTVLGKTVLGSKAVDSLKTCAALCHLSDHPTSPHTVTGLIDGGEGFGVEGFGIEGSSDAKDKQASIECLDCHTEHQGAASDITQLTQNTCQHCHAVQFAQFGEDHPPFSTGYATNSSLLFEHPVHLEKHFRNKQRETACESCHLVDAQGDRGLRLASFETMCADCHTESIDYSLTDIEGVNVIELPSIDSEFMAAQGVHLGQWPLELERLGRSLSPMAMALILKEQGSGIERGRHGDNKLSMAFMQAIAAGELDLSDLASACAVLKGDCDDDQWIAQQVQILVHSLKRILLDFTQEGEGFLSEDYAEAGISYASVAKEKIARMFDRLQIEMLEPAFVETKLTPVFSADAAEFDEAAADRRGWVYEDLRLVYRPTQHRDPLLEGLVDMAVQQRVETGLFSSEEGCFSCHQDWRSADTVSDANNATEPNVFTSLTDGSAESRSTENGSTETAPTSLWRMSVMGVRHKAMPLSAMHTPFNHHSHRDDASFDCQVCHQAPDKANKQTDNGNDHDFRAIDASQCIACHTETEQLSQCTTCHNYHAIPFE